MSRITTAQCVAAAARAFGVPHECLYARDRRQAVVLARFAAMRLARDAGLSFPRIGRGLGPHADAGMHHTNIIYGVRRAEELCGADPEYRRRFLAARAALSAPETAPS